MRATASATLAGLPLGNFGAEEQAMLETLVELRQRYRLQRCVIVGDRGLISCPERCRLRVHPLAAGPAVEDGDRHRGGL
jgi:hypothetical protein